MKIIEYSRETEKHFTNLKDYLESLILGEDVLNKYGDFRTTGVAIKEIPNGSLTLVKVTTSKNKSVTLIRRFESSKVTWSCEGGTILGLENIVPYDDFLEDLTTKLLLSMIKDMPNREKLKIKHTSTKLTR